MCFLGSSPRHHQLMRQLLFNSSLIKPWQSINTRRSIIYFTHTRHFNYFISILMAITSTSTSPFHLSFVRILINRIWMTKTVPGLFVKPRQWCVGKAFQAHKTVPPKSFGSRQIDIHKGNYIYSLCM